MEWMNNRKLGLNIIWNLKIRIFVLWILSLIVNYGQKNEMKFQWWTGWYLKLSVWGIVHRICDMWISPAFAAAAVPTLYIKMSSFLFIPLFFGYFSPQKQENQIVILLCYRGIKALFCMRRLKTQKGLGFCWSTFYNVVFTIDT